MQLTPVPVGDVLRHAAPVALSYVPLGVLYGALAQNAGLTLGQTLALSLIVYSGAAQILAAQMLAAGAAYVGIALAAAVLTLRHVLMGASLAVYTKGLSGYAKALLSPLMTDESFALGWKRYREVGSGDEGRAHPFFFGVNLCLYLTWNGASALGHVAGQTAPLLMEAGLDLVFPLLFIGILAGLISTRAEATAALGALIFAVSVRRQMPSEWLVLSAGIVAAFLGVAVEQRQKKRTRNQSADDPTEAGNGAQSRERTDRP